MHSNCLKDAHSWFLKWRDPRYLVSFSLRESYPAFSNFSLNDNPGSGDPEEGDITGYMNFGLEWKDILDEKEQYAATIFIAAGKPILPTTVDVTLRRLQQFKAKPGEIITLIDETLDGKEIIRIDSRTDRSGQVTFEGFRLTTAGGNRLIVRKSGRK